ncbi:MAG TPA: ABC transporter permease [Candidatus Polarisedimenticolaceae bacterium]|nr:ABC transporter permease [Candidatus Polarisedimenticolaceae bacterium]
MAIPLLYNVLSVRARWTSTVVAVLGIAGTVGVFVWMLAMARGFQAMLVGSGSSGNALVRRAGSTSEMESLVSLDTVKIVESAPGVARAPQGPLVSAEVVVVAAMPLRATGTDANTQVRGVSPNALLVRENVRIVEGRMFRPGLSELVVGKNAARAYQGFDLGGKVKFGGGDWTVVGVMDAGGSAFDSEAWCDAAVLNQVYKRPTNIFQSATVHLTSPGAFQTFKDALTKDPRLDVTVDREVDYYATQSRMLTGLIQTLGFFIAFIMGIGAVFAALNTMYSAVSERGREIATLRALGFGAGAVVVSFVLESMLVALVGGVLGALVVVPFNGYTVGTMNWQTFSHVSFGFKITPALVMAGIAFALLMGLIGGFPPALRAARRPIAVSLREL